MGQVLPSTRGRGSVPMSVTTWPADGGEVRPDIDGLARADVVEFGPRAQVVSSSRGFHSTGAVTPVSV